MCVFYLDEESSSPTSIVKLPMLLEERASVAQMEGPLPIIIRSPSCHCNSLSLRSAKRTRGVTGVIGGGFSSLSSSSSFRNPERHGEV